MHERCLRIVHSDKTSSSEKLLETGRSVLIHIINLQIFATEIFKVSKDQAPTIFSEFFSKRSVQHNLHHVSEFPVPNVKSTFHGTWYSLFYFRNKDLGFSSKGTQGALKLKGP